MHRWLSFFLLLGAGAVAGCGESDKAKQQNPLSAREAGPSSSQPQQAPPSLNELLKEAPSIPLAKQTFYMDDVEFAILAPLKAKIVKEGTDMKLTMGETAGIAFQWGHRDLAEEKSWWAGAGIHGPARSFLFASADTLVTEADKAADTMGEERFHFVTNVTTDFFDLSMQFTKAKELGKVVGTKDDCLLMLRCARTLAVVEPLPADPEAALKKLDIRFDKGDDGKITSLRFEGGKITRSGLALLKKFPDVKDLDFRFTTAHDTDFAVLKELPNVETMTFHSTFLRDTGLECLSKSMKLKKLDLTWTQSTPVGLEHLKGLPELRTLSLERLKLEAPDAVRLSGLTQLESLAVHYGSMDAGTVQAIAKLTNLKQLAFLDAGLDDAWAAPLGRLTNLETLTVSSALSDAKSTDALLVHLKGLRQLKTLNLRGTRVTESGVAELQKALPQTEIVVSK
jgi:hypothetical protein